MVPHDSKSDLPLENKNLGELGKKLVCTFIVLKKLCLSFCRFRKRNTKDFFFYFTNHARHFTADDDAPGLFIFFP